MNIIATAKHNGLTVTQNNKDITIKLTFNEALIAVLATKTWWYRQANGQMFCISRGSAEARLGVHCYAGVIKSMTMEEDQDRHTIQERQSECMNCKGANWENCSCPIGLFKPSLNTEVKVTKTRKPRAPRVKKVK